MDKTIFSFDARWVSLDSYSFSLSVFHLKEGVLRDAFTVGEFGLTPFPSLCISFERGVLRDELKMFRGWEILGSTSFILSAFHLKEWFWGMLSRLVSLDSPRSPLSAFHSK